MAGCASTPEEDPVQIKLNDLDTRLARIERVVSNQSLLDLANQSESLRNDLCAMHNDVDQLNNSLEASRKQQRDLYADLDRRLTAMQSAAGASVADSTQSGAGTGAVAGFYRRSIRESGLRLAWCAFWSSRNRGDDGSGHGGSNLYRARLASHAKLGLAAAPGSDAQWHVLSPLRHGPRTCDG